jgi:hypothetical protein
MEYRSGFYRSASAERAIDLNGSRVRFVGNRRDRFFSADVRGRVFDVMV